MFCFKRFNDSQMSEETSSPSSSPQIFFKDKRSEMKGPFTERQVQEWYRLKWFDSDFQFYFISNNEKPTDTTPFTALSDLITRFGSCCPFQRVERVDGMEEMSQKVETLEKEMASLKKECEQMRALKQRVIKLEKRVQALTAQPAGNDDKENAAPAAAKTDVEVAQQVAAATPQPAKSKYADKKWYGELVDLVVEAIEMLGDIKVSRADHIRKCAEMRKNELYYNEDEQKILIENVSKKMRERKEYYYCLRCDIFFLHPSQAFFHMNVYHMLNMYGGNPPGSKLEKMISAIVDLVAQAVTRWFMEIMDEEDKYANIPITSDMRPTNCFITSELIEKIIGGRHCGFRSKTAFFDAQISRINDNKLDAKIEKALREHIGKAQTYCDICDSVTGTVDEYWAHLCLVDHVMKMKLFHVPTIIANRQANKK